MFPKSLLLLILVVTVTYGTMPNPVEMMKVVNNCADQTNVNRTELDSPDLLKSTPSASLLCMVKCMMDTLDIIDSDGNVVKETMENYTVNFGKDIQDQITKCMGKIEKVNTCEDVEKYRKCIAPGLKFQ